MVPDEEQRGFLRRAVGYTLTGDTGEEKLFFIHGGQAAGKSTFIEAVKTALGDYAATADFETFLRGREKSIRNDVARLAGRRMVLSLEVDEGRRLAEGLVKSLTGGDTVAARFLNKEFFEFRPEFKLWLVANHKPRASAGDGALWRRVLLVPFIVSLPEEERDPRVKRVLTQDLEVREAILAWAVQGALEWRARGLAVPGAVRDATAAYREECDELAGFFDDRCEFGPEFEVPSAHLREECDAWCKANGLHPPDARALAAALMARGCKAAKVGGKRGWRGVKLGRAV
jgi:putative DNA primase/helicase